MKIVPAHASRVVAVAWFLSFSTGCASVPLNRSVPSLGKDSPEECDSDWDGAFLGAAIGLSPLVWSIATHGPGDGVPLGFKLGFVGGIAGFWIGLGLDSRNCKEPT